MRMTEQSSGSPARRRRTRRTQEAPEARVPEEPRVTNDDFGAGVDDAPEPWESRAEAFDAGPEEPERPLRDFSARDASDRDASDRDVSDREIGDRDLGEGANGEGELGEPGTDADRQGGYGPGGYDSGMPR